MDIHASYQELYKAYLKVSEFHPGEPLAVALNRKTYREWDSAFKSLLKPETNEEKLATTLFGLPIYINKLIPDDELLIGPEELLRPRYAEEEEEDPDGEI